MLLAIGSSAAFLPRSILSQALAGQKENKEKVKVFLVYFFLISILNFGGAGRN